MSTTTPKLYTLKVAGELLGVSRATIYRLVKSGDLPSVNIGTALDDPYHTKGKRIPADAIEAFIEARTNVA